MANSEEVTLLELEDIIVNFSSRGFASDKFFSAAASALDRRLNQKQSTGLRSDIVSLLESGVRALPQEPVAAYRESREREESILWSGSAFQLIPTEGMYSLLATLTQSYFTGASPDVTRWLDILTYAVTLRSDPWTWQAFALTDLWRLNQIDHEVARQFLAVLFEKQSEVLNCRAGMILLSYVMGLLEPEYLAKIIDRIGNSDWSLSEQACGELAGQDYFAHKNSWSRKLVEIGFTDSSKQNLAVGIAYTAGRAWRAARFRKEACKTIEHLLELNHGAVAEALAASMRLSEGLLPDDETFWLIDLLCSQPRLFRQGFAYIVEALPELMLWDAERVFRLLNAFTQEVGKDFLDHSTHMPYFAKQVVDATLTLQKIPGFEIKALELFEQQMALGMNEAQEIITEIDRLPKLMLRS